MAAGCLEGADDVEHRGAGARAEVEYAHAPTAAVFGWLAGRGSRADGLAGAHAPGHPVQRRHMSAG